MSQLETKHVCEQCGHESHRRPYLMAVDPDAAGWRELWSQWFAGEFSLLSLLAVVGPCVIVGLVLSMAAIS